VGVDVNAADYQASLDKMSRAEQAGLGVAAFASTTLGIIVFALRRRGRRSQLNERSMAQRLERTAANVPGGIYEYCEPESGPAHIRYASNGIRDVLGVEPRELCGDASRLFDLVLPEDRERTLASWESARRMLVLWRAEFRIHTADGSERWVECRALPMPAEDAGTVWYGHILDTSERKRVEQALEHARVAAESASRAKNEFVAKVSHELRTPIAAITGYTELLQDGGHSPRGDDHISERDAVDAISRNASHLLALVNDILDIARIEAGQMTVQPVPTNLRELANDVIGGLRLRVAERRLSLSAQVEKDVPALILTDPVRLRQILINLVTNAVKFTDQGSVWVSVRKEGEHAIAISVHDTGPGMTTEQMRGLFQPFSQVDNSMSRSFGGAGLGLAISKQLSELMGGRLTVASAPDRGSVFTVHIPRTPADSTCTLDAVRGSHTALEPAILARPGAAERLALAGAAWGASPSPIQGPPPLDGCRILLAEDGPDNARLISHHLRNAGALVTHVWDGRGALRLVEALGEGDEAPFDLILLDMQMPEMDGYTATEHMRAHGVVLPIVALTAHATPADRTRCAEAGCNDYATKPIPRQQLLDLCRKWARKPALSMGTRHASAQ
ncbi:MAG: response regulator, partial [Phycisphaerae bacterium]|nr:response regulator [Phycisphaerae bacterium]